VDREAEEERLKNLLRDDFIDDLKEGNFVPVQLPMIETGPSTITVLPRLESSRLNSETYDFLQSYAPRSVAEPEP
jgi:hypothetical protein